MTTSLRRAALLALAVVATACSDASPTAATPETPEPTTPEVRPNPLLRGLLGLDRQRTLEEQKQRELARVAAAAQLNGVLYATLTPVWNTASPLTNGLGLPLLQCRPLPYAADVEIVGPEGGVVVAGPHKLTIPAGALREPTVITAEAEVGLQRTVRFSPHGLTFDRPTTLEIDFDGCSTPAGTQPTIVYVDGQLNILEWIQSTVLGGDLLSGEVWHFSRYAAGRRSSYATSW